MITAASCGASSTRVTTDRSGFQARATLAQRASVTQATQIQLEMAKSRSTQGRLFRSEPPASTVPHISASARPGDLSTRAGPRYSCFSQVDRMWLRTRPESPQTPKLLLGRQARRMRVDQITGRDDSNESTGLDDRE
jgi:hypothetical protein